MSKMRKFLYYLFIILFIIILGEAIYILLIEKKIILTTKTSQPTPQKTSPYSTEKGIIRTTKNGLPVHESVNTSSLEYKKMVDSSDRAIHPTVLELLGRILKSPQGGGLYILQENTARVLEIEPKGACVEDRRNGVLYPGEICFPFAMKLENKMLPEGYTWVYFTDENIKRTNVYIKIKNEDIPVSLQEIKPNDVIFSVEKWDPSIPFDISKLKEYLDKQMIENNLYIINRNT